MTFVGAIAVDVIYLKNARVVAWALIAMITELGARECAATHLRRVRVLAGNVGLCPIAVGAEELDRRRCFTAKDPAVPSFVHEPAKFLRATTVQVVDLKDKLVGLAARLASAS